MTKLCTPAAALVVSLRHQQAGQQLDEVIFAEEGSLGFGLEPLDHERDRHCAVFYVKPHGQAERLGSTYSFLHFKY